MRHLTPLVQPNCPVCGSEYKGGAFIPGQRFKPGFRVFYQCGCSVSLPNNQNESSDECNAFLLLISSCYCDVNINGKDNLSDCEQIGDLEPKKFDPTSLNKDFKEGFYFVIEISKDDPHVIYMMDGEEEEEAKITKGGGPLIFFTSKDKAEDYVGNDKHEYSYRKMSKKTILKKFGKSYSHALIDPVYFPVGEDLIVPANNALLTKLK